MSGGLLVAGVASDAGKSVLVAGLCRWLRRSGVRVAPFKAMNMSNNSVVAVDGGEIGRAQAAQAAACGLEPVTAMNPVLFKPGGERHSHVLVRGRELARIGADGMAGLHDRLMDEVLAAYDELAAAFDVVVCEGAGGAAEINLRDRDLANLGLARRRELSVLVVGDVDRGGVFAGLFGTLALLSGMDQDHVAGFVVNKFRGDAALLAPGLDTLTELTGRPVLGVLPWLEGPALDVEDSLSRPAGQEPVDAAGAVLRVKVHFAATKTVRRAGGHAYGHPVTTGYEIHHGTVGPVADAPGEPFLDGWRRDAVWGTAWHGAGESDDFRRAFLADVAPAAPRRPTMTRPTGDASRPRARGPRRRPLLMVHTGAMKGKSTAAFGTAPRAWSAGLSVGVFQFVKGARWRPGECEAFEALGQAHATSGVGAPVEWQALGRGPSWQRRPGTVDDDWAAATGAWQLVRGRLAEQRHGFYLLDEPTYPITWGWLDPGEVVDTLLARPGFAHVVVTGRDADPALIEAADLVADLHKVKHPLDKGVRGQRGIEW